MLVRLHLFALVAVLCCRGAQFAQDEPVDADQSDDTGDADQSDDTGDVDQPDDTGDVDQPDDTDALTEDTPAPDVDPMTDTNPTTDETTPEAKTDDGDQDLFIIVISVVGGLLVLVCIVVVIVCAIRCHRGKRKRSREYRIGTLLPKDENPEEPIFDEKEVHKMGALKVYKQLMIPHAAKDDDRVSIASKQEPMLRSDQCLVYDVDSLMEVVVDEQGKRVPDSPRIAAKDAGRSGYVAATANADYEDDTEEEHTAESQRMTDENSLSVDVKPNAQTARPATVTSS